jgi:hypothetical protein
MSGRRQKGSATHWSVCDGRVTVGHVDQRDKKFVAIDINGQVVGEFPTLVAAAAAMPPNHHRSHELGAVTC